ncbi:MAG TPA: tetratricopeptide repeat protein [Caulobacteraceae bacterium]|nr:tetratricopeptide repeat protein [Caulobacteraceae bacterium]
MWAKRLLIAAAWLATLAAGAPAAAACKLERIATLPVTMQGLAPVVSAKIDGADIRLVAALGDFFSILSRSSANRLHLKVEAAPYGLKVLGASGEADVGLTTVKQFSVFGAPFHDAQFLVGGPEFAATADGLLGRNILMMSDAEFDLANGAVRLFSASGCGGRPLAYWSTPDKPYSAIDIEPMGSSSAAVAGAAYVNGIRMRVVFDSSASSVLSLRAAGRAGIHRNDPEARAAGLIGGFGHDSIETWSIPVQSFKIGDEEIKNTRLRVGAIELNDVDMVIGADFMLSHRIYIARSQNRVYFTYNGGPVFRLDAAAAAPGTAAPPGAPPPGPAAAPSPSADEPKDAAGFARRGDAFVARREYAQAIADFSRAMELDATDPQFPYARAMARIGARQQVLAMSDFDQALKIKPDFTLALLARGHLKLAASDDAAAGADFDAALRIDPSLILQVARVYENEGRWQPAIASYSQWIDANPKDDRLAFALNARCWARAQANLELDQALVDCNRALKLRPSTASMLDSRGLVHLRLGQYDQAIADYDAALKLQPKEAWSLYGRGLAELKTGKTAEGHADLTAAADLAPALAERAKRVGLGVDQDIPKP